MMKFTNCAMKRLFACAAIAAGGTTRDYSKEPRPNGARANIGVYGGTPEAARSGGGTVLIIK